MSEAHNVEYKQSWRDEYLKWVCGFANAQGGKIFIGMDDKGEVVGVADYKKLMDDIPNKTVNHLGLVVDVNLHKKNDLHSIEVEVPVHCTYFLSRCLPLSEWEYQTGTERQRSQSVYA